MTKRYAGNGTPFSRVMAYVTLANMVPSGLTQLSEIIRTLGGYTSRGHGKARSTGLTLAKAHRFSYNKYQPHQGSGERSRRLRTAAESQPRRLWSDIIAVIAVPEVLGYIEATTREGVKRKARFHGVKKVNPLLGVVYG